MTCHKVRNKDECMNKVSFSKPGRSWRPNHYDPALDIIWKA